jgi:tetratricopeptide (TPR) repeat protein
MKKVISAAFVLLVTAATVWALDTIQIKPPLIAPDTPENRRMVNDVLMRSAVLASRKYGEYFTVEYSTHNTRPDYTIEIIASLDNDSAGVFEIAKGDLEQSMSFLGVFKEESVGFIASIYASLWNTFTDGFAGRRVDPPKLLDVLPMNTLLSSVPGLAPVQVSSITAVSAVVKSTGNLLLAFGAFVAELDPNMHLVRTVGREMMEMGNYTFAGGVYLTPADTLFLRPTMGRQAQRLVDGSDKFQPINLGMDVFGPFTVLNDGTIVASDMTTQKTYRIDSGGRTELDLKTSPTTYIYYLGTGPEGNVWSWDLTERRFKIHTKDGVLIDTVTPITSATDYLTPMNGHVFPDGSFLLFVQGAGGFELRKYSKDGILAWAMNELDLPMPETIPNNLALAFDPARGFLYIVDFYGRRIFKLLDTDWINTRGIQVPEADQILEFNAALKNKSSVPPIPQILRQKAELYAERGAVELAIAGWKEVLVIDPYDTDASTRLTELQTEVLKLQAAAETERTLAFLDNLGPASAQMQYMNTLRIYEQILQLAPDDDDARNAMDDLNQAYLLRSTAPSDRQKPARIVGTELENLFPSLMLSYRNQPAGAVMVKNTTGAPITDLEVSFFIRKYMDFPAFSEPVLSVDDEEEVALPLFALFNGEVLNLQEDLPVQASIEATYIAGGEEKTISRTATVTLYRNTALTWDESGKLASFITPNEGVISAFAHRVLSSVDTEYAGLPRKMVRAGKLCDALGAYGIEYIEDPNSPFSKILGKAQVIDTVRFPRTTLYIRAGDCDDSTALLGSLLESSGIGTAIMTSPGHVFLAFDTAEPAENGWMFEAKGFTSLRHGGTVWLPIETTVLERGFLAAWETASGLVMDNPGEIEFLPVQEERDLYPPLPLGESALTVIEPQREEINRLLEDTMARTIALLYESGVDSLQIAIQGSGGRKELKIRNQLGVLHARFGEIGKAVSSFEENMQADPDYTASYLNLANLFVRQRRSDEAIEILRNGLARDPESANLNLLIARILHANGSYDKAKDHYSTVRGRLPELADRFAYLGEGGDTTKRAGIEWEDSPLIWAEGE